MKPTNLPRYACHKQVGALKIAAMQINEDGSAFIVPESHMFLPFEVEDFKSKYQPSKDDPDDPGYYVQYEDGYESWSPTKVFEQGYFRI